MKSYSQKNEQEVILKAVEELGIKQGFFVDIGAYDGETYSNTCALVELGWYGIMVEPGTVAFQKLLKRHGENDKITLVHAAVGAWHSVNRKPMLPFWENGTFSTTEANNRFEKFPQTGHWGPRSFIPQVRLDQVLELVSRWPIDVLSIDTEGTSYELFASLNFRVLCPQIVVVEHDQVHHGECLDVAARNDLMLVAENEENLIFRRK